MSAGRKAKVTPGKRRGNDTRSALMYPSAPPRARLQRDQDIRVRGTDGAGIAVGGIDAADRQAEIVDDRPERSGRDRLAQHVLDAVAQRRCLLDARAGRRADVQLQLLALDGREEVLAEEWGEPEGGEGDEQEPGDEPAAPAKRRRQQPLIEGARALEPALETALEHHQRVARRRGVAVAVRDLVGEQIARSVATSVREST